MKWVLASDHAAVTLKAGVKSYLTEQGFDVQDLGSFETEDRRDYPEVADLIVTEVLAGRADYGFIACGTGIGVSIRANRHRGVRAALIHSEYTAHMAKVHNNANIICMGGRIISVPDAQKLLHIFINANFEGGRHEARLAKLDTPS